MSDELCNHPKPQFYSLIISDLILLCSIFSNPLYISYLIFFSPYILRLISFLYPLFFTTSLISLALLTGIDPDFTSPVLEKGFPDDLGIYEILFGSCCRNEENPLDKEEIPETSLDDKDSSFCKKMEEKNPSPVSELKNSCPVIEERRLENFLKILDQFEKMSTNNNTVDEKRKIGGKIDKADGVEGVRQNAAKKIEKVYSQRIVSSTNVEKERNLKLQSFRTFGHNSNNESFGSMKKEKEWKRTLACKLFEERHNVSGGEGMDSLWEAYETDSNKSKRETGEKEKRGKKTSEIEFSKELFGDEDEDEVVDGQLCCLHAIKFSAGKMNLGMRKPNLVKISKAIKGFGWLHHVSKKVHNNGDK
ncbi:hypothetical protein CASFOL_022827 [Castilleja foliolosa]|uniref:Uncharacterized protein n=1 Tax=Castilleja foliolosa TaxID=1961234 RepID=A0ABD3CTH7_9LAMI